MKISKKLQQELKSSALLTSFLIVVFLIFFRSSDKLSDTLFALPFFAVLYFIFFAVGRDEISSKIRTWVGSSIIRVTIFPSFLILLYISWLLINQQNPLVGTLALIPSLLIFPILVFVIRRQSVISINWLDFTILIIYLLLISLIKVSPEGNLPFNGHSFDSLFRIFIVIIAVYVFCSIRGLEEVGFFPVFRLSFLWTALWVWFLFYLFVFIVGYIVDFIKISGHEVHKEALLIIIATTIISTFFHTAVYEELFFRGILQNMLVKRIGQSGSWKVFWKWGIVILLPFAFLVGYTLNGALKWFPAVITLAIFAVAFSIERANKNKPGVYTGLAITSVIFGLVHYHSGAIIYIGFACVAGWAYGYTYIRTKNVFYSAIVHTLVNCSDLIFGLKFMM